MSAPLHQYVDRQSGAVRTERLYSDRLVRAIYSRTRENAPLLVRALTSRRFSKVLGFINYDLKLGARLVGNRKFLRKLGVDLTECLEPIYRLNTARKIFERKIRYWECRPMPPDPACVVSPADARVLLGSFAETSQLRIKEKFFRYDELLGPDRTCWLNAFRGGDFAIFRLTPDKYHYNHAPVAGRVLQIYEVAGVYHSCNPRAVVAVATPYSKNKRVVTIIDTDVPGGTGVGLVAMIEIVALMIGEIVQCYSVQGYDTPQTVVPGMFLERGQPKSLYRPGSSTDVLVFQQGRVRFAADLVANMVVPAFSRFSRGFGKPLVETDVRVRSWIGARAGSEAARPQIILPGDFS